MLPGTLTRLPTVTPGRQIESMRAYLSELWGTRELLLNLTMREVKGQYRRTVFGQLWSLINPLGTMLVYTLVFHLLFRAAPHPGDPSGLNIYPVWLMTGLLPWQFFTHTLMDSMSSMTSSAGLVKKVYFPRANLPFARAGSHGFTWANEMLLLVVVVLLFGGMPVPFIPLVALYMVLLAMLATGIGMLLAVVNVNFRDTEHFITIFLRLAMYLTPIMYPIAVVENLASKHGEWILTLYRLNPMMHFIDVFRNLIYDNRLPSLSDCLLAAGMSIGVFVVGFLVFTRNEMKLVMKL